MTDCGNGSICPKSPHVACGIRGGCLAALSRVPPAPAIPATPPRGHPDACAHMATSITKAKQAQAKLKSNEPIGNFEVRYQMCQLVDATMDDLVNISGANCPQRLPELRSIQTALARYKCSERDKARAAQCRHQSTYLWRETNGQMRTGMCRTPPGGVRG